MKTSLSTTKTYTMKASEIDKKWHVIDATDLVLGRLASRLAVLLRGKHKPTFTPHMDCGDYVVVINAEKVHLTGNKLKDKRFYWHTGYTGIKERTMEQRLTGRYPERVIHKAVERMITRCPLGRKQMGNLKVYAGSNHPHEAQNPQTFEFGTLSRKNMRSA